MSAETSEFIGRHAILAGYAVFGQAFGLKLSGRIVRLERWC
jgi:hypothetical protein